MHGAFQRTTNSIRRLADRGIRVRVAMCVDPNTMGDIENTILLAKKLGAFAFGYNPVLPYGRGECLSDSSQVIDIKKVLQNEKRLHEQYSDFLAIMPDDQTTDLKDNKNCGAGWRVFTMDPEGNIRPCSTETSDKFVIGNLVEQSIEDVFSHPIASGLADFPFPTFEICGDCEHRFFCAFCGIRGLRKSQVTPNCVWKKLPEVQRVLSHWR